jgi:N-acetylmuramoyl-L-alanine amidase
MPSPFSPDSPLVQAVQPSPNVGARRDVAGPDMLILHYTGMQDCEAALRRLCEEASQVSCHYLVFEDGRTVQMVPEKLRAWHAGESSWEGATDINSRSIGIEICNPGHDYDYPDFPAVQIEAVIALSQDIVKRHKIRADRVLAHSDIAPVRKKDPGEKFPWETLHKHGIGLWVEPEKITAGESFCAGDRSEEIRAAQKELYEYGYGISPTGKFDEQTENVVLAFQRHFRPMRVDGVLDPSTRITLKKLFVIRPTSAA